MHNRKKSAYISLLWKINKSRSVVETSVYGPLGPSLEYMCRLLQKGNVEEFKNVYPLYLLQTNKDSKGNNFMHNLVVRCSEEGYEKVQKFLEVVLKEESTLTCDKNADGDTPLMMACERADCPQLIIALVEKSPETARLGNLDGDIPVLKFVQNMQFGCNAKEISLKDCCNIITILLKGGDNVNYENKAKKNVLIYLLERSDVLSSETVNEIANILFKNGAKLINKSGINAIKYLKKLDSKLIEIISKYCHNELIKNGSKYRTTLHHILENFQDFMSVDENNEKYKSLQIIYKNTATIENGNELISLASKSYCNYNIIQYLIHKTPNFKITPFKNSELLTRYATSVEIVNELVSYHTNVSFIDFETLETAAIAESKETIIRLLELGVNPLHGQTYDEFMSFISQDENTDLLKYVLGIPALKNNQKIELISHFYNTLIYMIYENFDNTNNIKTKEKLEIIIVKCKCENIYLLSEYSMRKSDILIDPIGKLISQKNLFVHNVNDCKEILDKLYNFIDMLLDVGLDISNLPTNTVTPLTMFLKSAGFVNIEDEFDILIIPIIDLLIEKGHVNIESNVLVNSEKETREVLLFKNEMILPDVLQLAFKKFGIKILEKFVKNWWGPPIALLLYLIGDNERLFQPRLTDLKYLIVKTIPFLLSYDTFPYGTSLICEQEQKLLTSTCTRLKIWSKETVSTSNSNEMNPASLQQLCKYVVRHSLATRAARNNVSLPQLLHELLPPLLRTVVIH